MNLLSVGPLRTASLVWQPKAGAWTFTVVCKATYVLMPGESQLAEEQDEPSEDDGHWDDDPERSLRFASDLSPIKTNAEVTLVGHAFAPEAIPVRSLVARMTVGELEKGIEVHADRAVAADGSFHEGSPFAHMPLVYERARGGPESWNPVGIPVNACDAHGRALLPNLRPLGAALDAIEPVGFGPIAPSWPGRRAKLGRRPAPVLRALAGTPLPWGFDLGFFNLAPPDQHLRTLRDDDRLILENLHPEHPRLVTRLPGLRPRAFVERASGAPSPLTMRPDTLAVDSDRGVCTLTWRGHFPLAHPDERGRVLLVVEHGSEQRTWSEVVTAAAAWRPDAPSVHRGSLPSIPHIQTDMLEPEEEVEAGTTTLTDHDARELMSDTLPFARLAQPLLDELRAARAAGREPRDLPFVSPATPSAPRPPPPPRKPTVPRIPAPPAPPGTITLAPGPPALPGRPVAPLPTPPPPPVAGLVSAPQPPVLGLAGMPPPSVPNLAPPPPPTAPNQTPPPPSIVAPPSPPPPPSLAGPASASGAPVLRALPGAESPWAGGVPSLSDPPRGTIGTLTALPPTPAAVVGVRDASTQDAVLRASNAAAGNAPAGPPAAVNVPVAAALAGAPVGPPTFGAAPGGAALPAGSPQNGNALPVSAGPANVFAGNGPLSTAPAGNAVIGAPSAGNAADVNAATGKFAINAGTGKHAKRSAAPAQGAADARSPQPPTTLDVFDLVWFDRAALPRIRKNPAWRALVNAMEDRPPDPDLDDSSLGNSPAEVEDKRDVFEVLAQGNAADAAGIEEVLSAAVRPDGKVVPPFVLAAGDLLFPFDEVETLKTHVGIISPLSLGDDKLRAEITLVREFLANPELACSPAMVDALSTRLWDAFARVKRAVPAETLKSHADSVLLQKRRFQKREVFGGDHLRALLHAGPAAGPFPSYLPAALSSLLPMYQRFRVRVFAEVHLAVDQHESCPTALRVVAIARIIERARRLAPEPPPTPLDSRPA